MSQERLEFAPQRDAFEERARGIDDATGLGIDAGLDRGDPVAIDADIGDGSVGQRAALYNQVETHLSPFWYGIIKALG